MGSDWRIFIGIVNLYEQALVEMPQGQRDKICVYAFGIPERAGGIAGEPYIIYGCPMRGMHAAPCRVGDLRPAAVTSVSDSTIRLLTIPT